MCWLCKFLSNICYRGLVTAFYSFKAAVCVDNHCSGRMDLKTHMHVASSWLHGSLLFILITVFTTKLQRSLIIEGAYNCNV